MKVLITGIAGFIGFHTACRLAAEGCAVVGVDSLNPYYPIALKTARLDRLPPGVRFVRMDVADDAAFRALVRTEAPDLVLHLAAQAGVRRSLDDPFAYAQANLLGHLSVLEACRHAPVPPRLVYASSSSVYGGREDGPFRETDAVDAPISLYAATKRSDELMSSAYAHLYGLSQIGLRFFTVYGDWGRPDMAYWLFTERMLRREPITVFNNGESVRDFTHIDDVTEAIWRVVSQPPRGPVGGHRLYNLGNTKPTPLMRMIAVLEDAVGHPAIKQMAPIQPGDVPVTHADVSALVRDYGFQPQVTIDEGLPRFVGWFRDHGHLGSAPVHANSA